MSIILELYNVCKNFGSLKALDNVTLKLTGTKITGLIGPNGAGKSVLINVITKVPYGPDRGKIIFNDTRIDVLKPTEISKLGIARTFQTIAFFPSLTVQQHLEVGAITSGVEPGYIKEVLDLVELGGKKREKTGNLSVFDLKRLMIASALSLDPKLIFIDEPLSGLSEEEVLEMLEILRRINETGRALVIIEHKIDEIMSLCERMIVLHLGRIIADGRPEEVTSNKDVLMAYFGSGEYVRG
jgi:branched-chain amino acid transport system ATP-binding protein